MAPHAHKLNANLIKWWKSHVHTNGMRTQVQSPYRKDHITSFIKHIPDSMLTKVKENGFLALRFGALFFGVIYWADAEFERDQKAQHWS
jgi:hypothetical protein